MNQPHPHNKYDGYLFFKADPLPGQRTTWLRVERTRIHATQTELYGMIYDRAFEISAGGQYQALSDERRAHVNQLIHDQRHQDPSVEWSCVYAKEHRRVVNDRDTVDRGHETVAMTVILMQRPWTPKDHARTPMGDLIDLRMSTNLNGQGQYVRAATTSGFPVGHMLPRDFAMSNAYQIPKPPQTQDRASMICLRKALSDRQSRMTNRSALPEG
ncbi:hypothetical protein N7509_000407 [Penicillium cosmopolitanum]|uniref:Uncharacterized protein n=1 Tax=Penicillium cosmopolitanum TaxID=1131564 RepID=A0A9X0BE55_9EURO|nr:uncharacterized protein N7509_000407 [Penicillium cosmopolitanum]KAJ5413780.1 hypothetical protein N7509_000407 [Penicillium cosmopolitanum]